ncbi:hypothetical protein AGOR_G00226580 [Albula goreensis]|uniref:Uncharacterized protein n=1 Tax=Albula goreensis TaxID=1534307 RepID=A0A8T3CIY9_9TELE|nr:hypothetical protein AGOR_G00226580 [Albula goreensis]
MREQKMKKNKNMNAKTTDVALAMVVASTVGAPQKQPFKRKNKWRRMIMSKHKKKKGQTVCEEGVQTKNRGKSPKGCNQVMRKQKKNKNKMNAKTTDVALAMGVASTVGAPQKKSCKRKRKWWRRKNKDKRKKSKFNSVRAHSHEDGNVIANGEGANKAGQQAVKKFKRQRSRKYKGGYRVEIQSVTVRILESNKGAFTLKDPDVDAKDCRSKNVKKLEVSGSAEKTKLAAENRGQKPHEKGRAQNSHSADKRKKNHDGRKEKNWIITEVNASSQVTVSQRCEKAKEVETQCLTTYASVGEPINSSRVQGTGQKEENQKKNKGFYAQMKQSKGKKDKQHKRKEKAANMETNGSDITVEVRREQSGVNDKKKEGMRKVRNKKRALFEEEEEKSGVGHLNIQENEALLKNGAVKKRKTDTAYTQLQRMEGKHTYMNGHIKEEVKEEWETEEEKVSGAKHFDSQEKGGFLEKWVEKETKANALGIKHTQTTAESKNTQTALRIKEEVEQNEEEKKHFLVREDEIASREGEAKPRKEKREKAEVKMLVESKGAGAMDGSERKKLSNRDSTDKETEEEVTAKRTELKSRGDILSKRKVIQAEGEDAMTSMTLSKRSQDTQTKTTAAQQKAIKLEEIGYETEQQMAIPDTALKSMEKTKHKIKKVLRVFAEGEQTEKGDRIPKGNDEIMGKQKKRKHRMKAKTADAAPAMEVGTTPRGEAPAPEQINCAKTEKRRRKAVASTDELRVEDKCTQMERHLKEEVNEGRESEGEGANVAEHFYSQEMVAVKKRKKDSACTEGLRMQDKLSQKERHLKEEVKEEWECEREGQHEAQQFESQEKGDFLQKGEEKETKADTFCRVKHSGFQRMTESRNTQTEQRITEKKAIEEEEECAYRVGEAKARKEKAGMKMLEESKRAGAMDGSERRKRKNRGSTHQDTEEKDTVEEADGKTSGAKRRKGKVTEEEREDIMISMTLRKSKKRSPNTKAMTTAVQGKKLKLEKIDPEPKGAGTEVDVVFLSERPGNRDEVIIDRARRLALQREIDLASR